MSEATAQKATEALPEYPASFIESLVQEKIEQSEVGSVLAEFQMSVSLGELGEQAMAIVVTDESQTDLMKQARDIRLKFVKERNRIEKARKEIKEPYKRKVDVIDGVGRIIRRLFEEAEAHLDVQENFAVRKQAERTRLLVESRTAELVPYVSDITPYLSTLGQISHEAFAEIKTNAQTAFEAEQKAKADAELKAQEEAAALRIENERLEREAAEQRLAKEAARIEREAADKIIRDQQEAEANRLANEKAEQMRLANEKARAAAAPDREKLTAFADAIINLATTELPACTTDEGLKVSAKVSADLKQIAQQLQVSAELIKAPVDPDCPF